MCYKPVILIGNGCRGNPVLVNYLCGLGIPVLTTWMAADLVPEDSPVFCGRSGVVGQRAANIIQQMADQIFVVGARLDGGQVAHNLAGFAPKAEKVVIDVDPAELNKLPSTWVKRRIDLHGNFGVFMDRDDVDPSWLAWCRALYARFRPELDGIDRDDYVDPYRFISLLSEAARPDDIFISGAGTCCEAFMQSFKVKRGQRVMPLASNGAMGADIPMAIGAAFGAPGRRVICVTGDGGFAINSPELEVVRRHNLNIRFFVFNNSGYGSIRNMQKARFGRVVGADEGSGFSVRPPDLIADSYNLRHDYYGNAKEIYEYMDWDSDQPTVYELQVAPDFTPLPKVMSSAALKPDPMEDMTPHLDPAELKEIMDYGNRERTDRPRRTVSRACPET